LRTSKHVVIASTCLALLATLASAPVEAQNEVAQEMIRAHATNRPLQSLAAAAERARANPPTPRKPREIVNFRGEGKPAFGGDPSAPDAVLQDIQGSGVMEAASGFFGASNNDNAAVVGYMVAPPDTDGAVGPGHFVQMVNMITTVFYKNGTIVPEVGGPFPSNAFWVGIGGNCQAYNQGDPIVLYDDVDDRWLVSQFAFPDNLATFSQCVAVSQTDDPLGAWNRYEYPFDGIGFNDYPKHGIVSDSITMTAHLFSKRGQNLRFAGSYLGVMNKEAMYAGADASLIGFKIGAGEFGFVAGDLDGSGSAPALFATAMSQANLFDIWQIDVDWATENASASRIASIPITPFSGDLCAASREACIPQPDGGPALEALSDRLMHRLQLRDFGTYRTMVTAHTVDVGGGRAGIRWYELRESGGDWSLHQEGTFGPNDGEHRWLPSAAMNAGGDIGIGYALSSTNTYVSTMAAGQSAAGSGTGLLDAGETVCVLGSGVQEGTGRSGDYSATSIDPTSNSFWHTNEAFTESGNFLWDTYVCEFTVGTGNIPPTASFTYTCNLLACSFDGNASSDSDGTIQSYDWNFGDGNTGTGVTANHTYDVNGTYTVTLTVTDDGDATDATSQPVTVSEAVNTPPTASFTFNCTDLTCDFTDASNDSDGTVDAWSWDFGESGTSTAQNPSYSYTAAGTYTVTLIVTDDGDATGSTSQPVTATEPSTGITLTATGYKVRGRQMADLEWDGATGDYVDVYRDGAFVTTTGNDGAYTDDIGQNGSGTHTYQVCEEGTDTCSNEVIVNI